MTQAAAPERKKRILVVDDTEVFLIAVKEMLEQENFEVLIAKDGLEAVQTVKHEMPNLDLVLLDLLLPQLTGFEVLKQIREGKLGKDLPVLVITGVFKKAQQINQLKKLGATGYMNKSQKLDEIVRRVKATLGLAAEQPAAGQAAQAEKPEDEKLDREEFLSRTEVFSGLDKSQMKKAAGRLDEMSLNADRKIFNEGDEGDSFYIVVKGSVRVVKTGEAKEEEVLAVLDRGSSFGEMALVARETRSAAVITNEPSVLLRMKKDDFEKLLKNDKELALVVCRNFVQLLCNRLRATSESLTFSRSLLEELRKK